jgi:protein involved in polysaccharide export with SLBB domain
MPWDVLFPTRRWRLAPVAWVGLVLAGLSTLSGGCAVVPSASDVLGTPPQPGPVTQVGEEAALPHELNKVSLPEYVIEPPDILLIDAVKVVPKAPYRIDALDVLFIQGTGLLPESPLAGQFPVEPGGRVNLGPMYGTVRVIDLTPDEAQQAISTHLQRTIGIRSPEISVQLVTSSGMQMINGEHLVTPDGSINLGTYGSVYVAGMTLKQARLAIEAHLAEFLDSPSVSVDVFSYNSKVYYVITEGAGNGDQIVKLPITGSETVLDALATVGGTSIASSMNIWVARPTPNGCDQILPFDYRATIRGGAVASNYQLLPGDRVVISEDPWRATSTWVDKTIDPFERMLGFALLGSQTVQNFNRFPKGLRQSF